jgi:hypothetical protein
VGVLNIGIHKDDTSSLYDLNPFTKIEKAEPPIWAPKSQTKLQRNSLAKVNEPTLSTNNIADLSEKVNT